MLGDISPQSVKIDSSAVVYPGRNHVTALSVKRFDGTRYSAADVSALTRVVLVFPQLDPVVAFDSSITAGVFTWSGSTITVDLSDFSMPSSIQQSYLIVYDAEHTSGQVLVDDNSSVLEWDFRNISAAGIVQPPVVELVGEAPINGLLYGRKDGAWFQIDAIVAGVSSVNGKTGTVLLNSGDVPEGGLNLYFTNARAAAAAPVQSVNGQTGVVSLTAANVGAEAAGTAAAAVAAHEAAANPHSQYVQNATNVGGANGLFKQNVAGVLEFKTLAPGSNVTITPVGDTLVLAATGGGGGGSVDSVNGQTGVVVLDAADVGADPAGTAAAAVAAHEAAVDPHPQYATDASVVDARFQSTGLVSGGALSINGGDNTKFDVAAGVAVFADYTNPQQSDATVVSFGPLTAITVPNLATANVSYIGINVSGTIVQQTTQFSNTQRRSICSLGAVVHSNHINLNAVNTIVAAHRQLLNQFGDGIRAIGQLNLSGNVYSAVGANLQIQKTSGELFSPGANFHSNPNDPHSISLSAGSPLTFRYRLANGTEFADTTLINPAQYDNAGVLTAVPNNKFTVQLIAVFQSGLTRLQYGQVVYDTLADAVAGAQSQSMTLEQNIAENGIVRGYLAVKFDATALNNTAQAQFITLSKFSAAAAVSPLSISTTDQLAEGTTNLYHTAARVRNTILTGLSTATNAVITAADTVLDAFGKLQAQFTAHFGSGGTAHANATTSVAGFLSAADKTKLDGVATGATANQTDAFLLARANHTGTQAASTISDFSEAVDDRVSSLLVAGTNITLTYNDPADTLTIAASGGGGLTSLTEAKNSAAPNATVPIVSLTVTIAETNGGFAVIPKGTGPLLASIPNSAASGGDVRGDYAVDWQRDRSSQTQVASGLWSTLSGGRNNMPSGQDSTVSGGNGNNATNTSATVSGGLNNSASGTNAFIGGGSGNTASGGNSVVAGGSSNTVSQASAAVLGGGSNTADGEFSSVLAGRFGHARGVYGSEVRSSGRFAVTGDAQRGRHILRIQTTNATATQVTSNASPAAANNQPFLPDGSAFVFSGRVVARNVANGDASSWEFKGLIKRGSGAGTIALVAAVTPTVIAQDAGASGWAVTVTADTTNGCLSVNVAGAAATNLNWVADVETVEVVG